MRRRLVAGAVAIVALAMLLFAVPLGVVLRQQIVSSALDGFAATLEQTATLVDERSRTCGELQALLASLAREGVDVAVFDREGDARFAQADAIAEGRVVAVPSVLTVAAEGATGATLVDGDPVVAVPLSTLTCGERLVLQARTDGGDLARQVRRALVLVATAGLVAVVAGGLAASGLAARLARPLERLAASARRLGEGDFSERAPRAGLPEPDGIADALDVTADRLGRAVERATAFTADASHQLRTPMTALRLQLESAELGLEPDDPRREALDGALAEVDRLTATVDELVALTQVDAVDALVDVAALVGERAEDWARRAGEGGRVVTVTTDGPVHARVREAAILQAVDVLVDNALRHGHGRVDVAVDALRAAGTRPQAAGSLRISVRDEGPGLPEDLAVLGDRVDRGALPLHGGRGLALARDLVEGEGGRLALRSGPDGTIATLLVPVVAPRGGPGAERAS